MDALTQTFGKKAHNASKLIEHLYQKPIVTLGEVTHAFDVIKTTAANLVKGFEDKGILAEVTGYQSNKHYIFKMYLDIYSTS